MPKLLEDVPHGPYSSETLNKFEQGWDCVEVYFAAEQYMYTVHIFISISLNILKGNLNKFFKPKGTFLILIIHLNHSPLIYDFYK